MGTSCHTSPTENYSETAPPDSRTIEKPALTFPRSLQFAASFPSPFPGLFYRLHSWCQGFHCNTVNFSAPVRSCTQTQEQLHQHSPGVGTLQGGSTRKPHTHSWPHQSQILHDLKPNSALREEYFLLLQFSSQLSPFILLPKSLCLCWKRTLQCHTAPLSSHHFTCSVILNTPRKVFCHFKQENRNK